MCFSVSIALLCTRLLAAAGELELWNKAEAALEEALNSTGREWVMNPGDGAFYGPKIDITGEPPLLLLSSAVECTFLLCFTSS